MQVRNLTLTANVTAINGQTLNDGQVTFTVNGIDAGTSPVTNGTGTLNYLIPSWLAGNYSVLAEYLGTNNCTVSNGTNNLTVNPSAYLYLEITTSNNNPLMGVPFVITYKLGNSGPDPAANVTIVIPIPVGLEFITASVDNGNWTYNAYNRTLIWTLPVVPVGDPYLNLTMEDLNSGKYNITSNITSDTFNQNPNPFTIIINVKKQNNNNTGNNTQQGTIPMQNTGAPLTGLALAIISVLGGILGSKKR